MSEDLTWTTLTAEVTPQWSTLTNTLAEHDDTGQIYDAEDLAEELAEHGFDRERGTWAVWAGQELVAFGQLRVAHSLTQDGHARADIIGGVDPDWRGRGIGTALLDKIEPQALELATQRHPGAPVRVHGWVGKDGSTASELFGDRGFQAVRYFTDMKRDLPGEPAHAANPRVQPYRPELAEAVRLAHNDAFQTHWGSTAKSPAQWHNFVTARSFRGAESRVVVDDDGTVLAYCLIGTWVDRELYVSLVGTRQQARGQGLARAVLQAAVADAAASGAYDLAKLGVDSEHPSGALGLYSSVGFSPIRTMAVYAREVAPA